MAEFGGVEVAREGSDGGGGVCDGDGLTALEEIEQAIELRRHFGVGTSGQQR